MNRGERSRTAVRVATRALGAVRRGTAWVVWGSADSSRSARGARFAPRQPRLVVTLTVVALTSVALLWLLFCLFATIDGATVVLLDPLDSRANGADLSEVARTTVATAGVFAGIAAIVYAYRKQRLEEAGSRRADEDALSKRYQDAAAQLGHSEPAVRLAGAYAMARLADDWPEERQTCVDVLCAYIRMPVSRIDATVDEVTTKVPDPSELEVRSSIMRTITDHLQISRPSRMPSWHHCTFDFSNAEIFDLRMVGCHFAHEMFFHKTKFVDSFIADCTAGWHFSFIHCVFTGRNEIENIVSPGQVLVRGSTITSQSSLRFGTPIDEAPNLESLYQLDALSIRGRLSVAINKTKSPQPKILLTNLMVSKAGKVFIANQDNPGTHGRDGDYRPAIAAHGWHLDDSAHVEIDADLVDAGLLDKVDEISDNKEGKVSVTSQPANYWGRK